MLLGINIDRTKFTISTLLQFENLDKTQLLLNLHVMYRDERGIDGGNSQNSTNLKIKGGLRRECFSMIAKELFDPRFGLFKLSENKRGIQPNPLASIIPNYLLYFEFAGIMLAKVTLFVAKLN